MKRSKYIPGKDRVVADELKAIYMADIIYIYIYIYIYYTYIIHIL